MRTDTDKHIPKMTHDELEDFILSTGTQITTMVWSEPGVGKTETFESVAEKLGLRFVHIVATMLNPEDLRVPVVDPQTKLTSFCPPEELFGPDENGNPRDVLVLLDEITNTHRDNQAAAFPLVHERRLGHHRLSENSIVAMAGNPITTSSAAGSLPAPLMGRAYHVRLTIRDTDSWLRHAASCGVHPLIQDYVRDQGVAALLGTPLGDDEISTNPRAWTRAGQVLGNSFWKLDDLSQKLQDGHISAGSFQDRVSLILGGAVNHKDAVSAARWMAATLQRVSLTHILSGQADLPGDPTTRAALMHDLNRRLALLPALERLASPDQRRLATQAVALLRRLQDTPDLILSAVAGTVPDWLTAQVTNTTATSGN